MRLPVAMLLSVIALAFVFIAIPASAAPALRGDGVVTFFRPDKQERGTFRYRDAKGRYNADAIASIAHFFRCRLTDESHPIDTELIEILDAIQDHFNAPEVRLISTYRSPERNAMMRRHKRGVAKESLHMQGRAADIEVPGISRVALRDFAYALHGGGVGFYRRSSFVHVDTGGLRAWGFKPRVPTRGRPATAHK